MNDNKPGIPPSTPSPLHLFPSSATPGVGTAWALTQDVPHSSRVASAAARSGSALHTAHRAVQPEVGVIGPRERVLDIVVRHDRQYRPELLLSDDPHPFIEVRQDGRCEEVAVAIHASATGLQRVDPPGDLVGEIDSVGRGPAALQHEFVVLLLGLRGQKDDGRVPRPRRSR
ncbi:hypothetical protein OHB00_01785 [Streptomyces sp. NBC_00631]